MSAVAVVQRRGAIDEVDPDDWSTFAEDSKAHQICALCGCGADTDRPLLDAYLGSNEFKAHGDCAFGWAEKHNGRGAEVRS
jgi:hypothetical protein